MSDGAHKRTRTCAVPEQTCAVTEAATATRNDNKVFGYRRETSDMMVTPVLRFNGTFTVDQEIAILTWLSLADVGAYALTCSDATRMAYLHLKHATHMVVEHPEIKATDDTQSSVCTHVYRWACHAATQHCAQLRIITINKYVIACRHCTPSRMRRLLLKLIHGSMQTLENVEAYPEYSTFAIALATTKCRRLQRYFGPHHYSEGNATAAEHTGMTHYLELLSANCRSITDVQFSTPDINRLRDSISQSTSIVTYTALERYLKGFPFIHLMKLDVNGARLETLMTIVHSRLICLNLGFTFDLQYVYGPVWRELGRVFRVAAQLETITLTFANVGFSAEEPYVDDTWHLPALRALRVTASEIAIRPGTDERVARRCVALPILHAPKLQTLYTCGILLKSVAPLLAECRELEKFECENSRYVYRSPNKDDVSWSDPPVSSTSLTALTIEGMLIRARRLRDMATHWTYISDLDICLTRHCTSRNVLDALRRLSNLVYCTMYIASANRLTPNHTKERAAAAVITDTDIITDVFAMPRLKTLCITSADAEFWRYLRCPVLFRFSQIRVIEYDVASLLFACPRLTRLFLRSGPDATCSPPLSASSSTSSPALQSSSLSSTAPSLSSSSSSLSPRSSVQTDVTLVVPLLPHTSPQYTLDGGSSDRDSGVSGGGGNVQSNGNANKDGRFRLELDATSYRLLVPMLAHLPHLTALEVSDDAPSYLLHALVAFSDRVPRLAHIDINSMQDDDDFTDNVDGDAEAPTTVSTLDTRALADLMGAFPHLCRFILSRRRDRFAVEKVIATLARDRQRNIIVEQ